MSLLWSVLFGNKDQRVEIIGASIGVKVG